MKAQLIVVITNLKWNIAENVGHIAAHFVTEDESWKHLWSPDFPSGAAIKSTLAVQSEMSQQQQKAIYMVFG